MSGTITWLCIKAGTECQRPCTANHHFLVSSTTLAHKAQLLFFRPLLLQTLLRHVSTGCDGLLSCYRTVNETNETLELTNLQLHSYERSHTVMKVQWWPVTHRFSGVVNGGPSPLEDEAIAGSDSRVDASSAAVTPDAS